MRSINKPLATIGSAGGGCVKAECDNHQVDWIQVETTLSRLLHQIQSQRTHADAGIAWLDDYVGQLSSLGLFLPSLHIGNIVLKRARWPRGPEDSHEIVQAAFGTEHGSTAIVWDSDDYEEAQDSEEFSRIASRHAVPLQQCCPAIRALVWPHVPELALRLMADVKIL